jgi:hypothetical protein
VDKTQAFKNAASQLRTWSAVCLLGAGASYANGLPTLSQIPDLLWFAFDSSLEARKLLAKKLGEKDKAAKALIGKNKDKIVAAWEVLKQNAKVRLAFQKGFAELDLKRRSQYSPLYTGLRGRSSWCTANRSNRWRKDLTAWR